MTKPFKWIEHPGPAPEWDPKDVAASLKAKQRWEELMLMWGFADMRYMSAFNREENRQDHMKRLGIDPVKATTELHRRRGLL